MVFSMAEMMAVELAIYLVDQLDFYLAYYLVVLMVVWMAEMMAVELVIYSVDKLDVYLAA